MYEKKEVETRWNTCYDIFKSIPDHFEQLKKYAILKDYVDQINHRLLAEISAFLKPLTEKTENEDMIKW